MSRERRWLRPTWIAPLLVSGVALALAGCSGETPAAAPESAPVSAAAGQAAEVEWGKPLIVNVAVGDQGFEPSVVFLPRDRYIQLVLRNPTTSEHHYHVAGMPMTGLMWPGPEDGAEDTAVVADQHEHDHGVTDGLVPYHICKSASGICPTGDWVHAHANAQSADMIFFVPTTPGEYIVGCPLHADFSAKVVVY